MISLLFPALLLLATQAPAPASVAVPAAKAAPQPSQPLSFFSQRFPYQWDRLLPLTAELDGLKIKSIFFNKRTFAAGPFKGANFGTRAEVEVTNASQAVKNPGFAVAVFDSEDRLLGVATGGSKFGHVGPGETETFELNFHQVLERLPKGDHFFLSVELAP